MKYKLDDGYVFNMTDTQLRFESNIPPFVKEYANYILLQKIADKQYIFAEVGAFIGTYSIRLAKHYGKVYAFEPNPENYFTLMQNIEENNVKNIEVFNVACADFEGEADFYLGGPGSSLIKNPSHIGAVRVKVNKLDNLIDKADVFKIDCEGGEVMVIKGMQRIISEHHPIIIIEHHELRAAKIITINPIWGILKKHGYMMLNINDCHRGYYHPSRPKEMLKPLLAHHVICYCFNNLASGKPWYNGLPLNWWWGMTLLDFIYEIENHVIKEKEWLELVPK